MYFSKWEKVFFQIGKCIFPNWKMYFSKLENVFLQIGKEDPPLNVNKTGRGEPGKTLL